MIDLKCPNCGATVGEASMEDNYKSKYTDFNKKGEPVCKNWNNANKRIFKFIIFVIIISVVANVI